MADTPTWGTARTRLRDRIDAVIAHEYTEAKVVLPVYFQRQLRVAGMTREIGLFRHYSAVANVPNVLPHITPTARRILAEYRERERVSGNLRVVGVFYRGETVVHHEQLGRFDHDALLRSQLVVREPLDVGHVDELFRQFGDILSSGERIVDGHVFTLHPDGYVKYRIPGNRPRVVEFIVRLARETGSEIANAEWGTVTSPDELAAAFEHTHRQTVPA